MRLPSVLPLVLVLLPISLLHAETPKIESVENNLVVERLAGKWTVDTDLTTGLKGKGSTKLKTMEMTPDPTVLKTLPKEELAHIQVMHKGQRLIGAGRTTLSRGASGAPGVYTLGVKDGQVIALFILTPPGREKYSVKDAVYLTLVPGKTRDLLFVIQSTLADGKIAPKPQSGSLALSRPAATEK